MSKTPQEILDRWRKAWSSDSGDEYYDSDALNDFYWAMLDVIGEKHYPVLKEDTNFITWVEPIIGESVNTEEAQKPVYNKGRNDTILEQWRRLDELFGRDK